MQWVFVIYVVLSFIYVMHRVSISFVKGNYGMGIEGMGFSYGKTMQSVY